jgi:hypothetical protein
LEVEDASAFSWVVTANVWGHGKTVTIQNHLEKLQESSLAMESRVVWNKVPHVHEVHPPLVINNAAPVIFPPFSVSVNHCTTGSARLTILAISPTDTADQPGK